MVGMVFVAQNAYATNGYFTNASGVNDQALGGAGVALPQDTLDAAVNPANMVFLGKQYDLGIAFFNPNRQYTVNGASGPPFPDLTPGTVKSDSKWFVIPSFGANWVIDENSSFGLSIFGNGGMNTDYPTNTFNNFSPAGSSSPTGVDLMQLFIAPTYARKLAPKHALGITPILAIQRFEARGLQPFDNPVFSSAPGNVTNNGYSYSYGYGARIGYQGEIVPNLNLGLAYQTKTYMTKLDEYKGLFADGGGFDIPSNWTAGLAFKATPELAFVFDVQRINYSQVKSIANPFASPAQLGAENGPGFGWHDMTIYKMGVQWQSSKEWIWRAGYSIGNQPIRESEVLFNILAPGVIEQHATVGFTRVMANNNDLNFAFTRAFQHSVTGPNPFDPAQTIELKMDQWQIAASYS
ncbi:MAG TPA: outer membrane protein transport protein, partial [Saprospiraceae bacterium]|nr:outer membrane protein transport protein [Saprospiraceae bacterium]